MFKMTPDLCTKTIEELKKMSSIDLVTIMHQRQPKNVPENFFSFIKYRAGTILETRDDRYDAKREYERREIDKKFIRSVRGLVRAIPEIAEEKWFLPLVTEFLKG